MPRPVCHGERKSWLSIPSQTLRLHGLPAWAIKLGLCPPKGTRLSTWLLVVVRSETSCPPLAMAHHTQVVYVAPGNVAVQRSPSVWANPWMAGRDDSRERCGFRFDAYLRINCWRQLSELSAKTLWCDCSTPATCYGFHIVSACYLKLMSNLPEAAATSALVPTPLQVVTRRLSAGKKKRVVAIFEKASPSVSSGEIPCLRSHLKCPQDAFSAAIRPLFRVPDTMNLRMPIVEDLLSCFPFTAFGDWLDDNGLRDEVWWQPRSLTRIERRAARASLGFQERAYNMAGNLPQLLPFGLSAEEHFQQSLKLSKGKTPLERQPPLEEDLRFAASIMVANRNQLVNL
jgi:hypothetical protein